MIEKVDKLLFVCTGNTCRSPMAEYMAREILPGIKQIASRGLSAGSATGFSTGATIDAIRAVREIYARNFIFIHEPKQLRPRDVVLSDLVLTMEERHRDRIISELEEFVPTISRKVFALKEFSGLWPESKLGSMDVSDPMASTSAYSVSQTHDLEDFDFGDLDTGNGYAFGSGKTKTPGEKRINGIKESYVIARDEIRRCLEIIASGKIPSFEAILNERQVRYQEQEKAETRRLITHYGKIREDVLRAKSGAVIELPYTDYKGIVLGKEKIPGVKDLAEEIYNLAHSRKVKLAEKKYPQVSSGTIVVVGKGKK